MKQSLPIPEHFNKDNAEKIWPVRYQKLAGLARAWVKNYKIEPAHRDTLRICLFLIDEQITFCIPGSELFVGGRSGRGAVEDTIRLCEFIYRNLHIITHIVSTMDTHQVFQIFHDVALVSKDGKRPEPFTLITPEDMEGGKWALSLAFRRYLDMNEEEARDYLAHYVRTLNKKGKFHLTIWPYHAMLGGIGHALVPAIEEAIFFHAIARETQPDIQLKGNQPLTENYSVLRPEVIQDHKGRDIGEKNTKLMDKLFKYDAIVVAGQAKSHCVSWTLSDLLDEIKGKDPSLANRIYLLDDCTSPVVVPGVMDYTEIADNAFRTFSDAGMHMVRSTTPISEWPGMNISQ